MVCIQLVAGQPTADYGYQPKCRTEYETTYKAGGVNPLIHQLINQSTNQSNIQQIHSLISQSTRQLAFNQSINKSIMPAFDQVDCVNKLKYFNPGDLSENLES